jgi:uncharacterized protein YuzB (UPF0349 family)
MRPTIEFCAGNMHCGTQAVMKTWESRPDLRVIEYGCLGNCGECYRRPYALVNGEIVAADSPGELEAAIGRKLGNPGGPSGSPET